MEGVFLLVQHPAKEADQIGERHVVQGKQT